MPIFPDWPEEKMRRREMILQLVELECPVAAPELGQTALLNRLTNL
jgi:hypothetical protein